MHCNKYLCVKIVNMIKPYSESCDQNQLPILNVIKPYLEIQNAVLEIGSGTGQHAVFFAKKLPHLIWYTSDREEYHDAITQWLNEAKLDNTKKPITLDVSHSTWPKITVDTIFSANTTHIMHWLDVKNLFCGVGKLLTKSGLFLLYGPFNFNGKFTSASNQQFDQNLKNRDPLSGIRNVEDLMALAFSAALNFIEDHPMPHNNRLLVWQKL